MKTYSIFLEIQLMILFTVALFASSNNLIVRHQISGPIKTNCYLIYDIKSNEAALIDVGGIIDSLIFHIESNNLELKYIFITHGHMDHVEGIPIIKKKYPNAKLCINKDDYDDFLIHRQWGEKNIDPKRIEKMKQNPEIKKWFDYDLNNFIKPDIYVKDDETYKLGDIKIKTFLSPGHSGASICYLIGDILFSGDLLFYHQVGRTDNLHGSKELIVNSVRRLYANLPDTTKVYPGHGQFTDIRTEKMENDEVTINKANVKN